MPPFLQRWGAGKAGVTQTDKQQDMQSKKRAANKHLNTGNQILWLMQKTLVKNEVNVGNAITASASDARLYN